MILLFQIYLQLTVKSIASNSWFHEFEEIVEELQFDIIGILGVQVYMHTKTR